MLGKILKRLSDGKGWEEWQRGLKEMVVRDAKKSMALICLREVFSKWRRRNAGTKGECGRVGKKPMLESSSMVTFLWLLSIWTTHPMC